MVLAAAESQTVQPLRPAHPGTAPAIEHGYRHDLRAVAALAHAHRALCYTDGIQAVGMFPVILARTVTPETVLPLFVTAVMLALAYSMAVSGDQPSSSPAVTVWNRRCRWSGPVISSALGSGSPV